MTDISELRSRLRRAFERMLRYVNVPLASGMPSSFPECRDGDLTLRGLREQEIAVFSGWLRDLHLARYAFGLSLDADDSYIQGVVNDHISFLKQDRRSYVAICVNNKLIGCIYYHIRDIDGLRFGILGIFIGLEEERGRGYGTRSLDLLLGFLFGELGCSCVELDTANYNKVAQRTYEGLGFSVCADQRFYEGLPSPNDIELAPSVYYRLTKEQWQARHI
ncbi:GNAT family N-acetyltransferase [bacterium]|nr:GNAT family N-acetyltransferase [bacterium]